MEKLGILIEAKPKCASQTPTVYNLQPSYPFFFFVFQENNSTEETRGLNVT